MKPQPSPTITTEIERHIAEGDAHAAASLARLASCEPHLHHEGLLWDAIVKLGQGQPRDALRPLQRAAWLLPRRSELHGLVGTALAMLGEHRLAARSFSRALERDPRDVRIRGSYLRALVAGGDPEALNQARRLLVDADSPAAISLAVGTLGRAGIGPVGHCRKRSGRIEGCFWDQSGSRPVELAWKGGRASVSPVPLTVSAGRGETQPLTAFEFPWPAGAQIVHVRTAAGEEVPGSPLRHHVPAEPWDPPAGRAIDARIDVVIPVYKDYAATAECLRSVIAGTDRAIADIVVVDDASPDAEITALLDRLDAEKRITLLRNPENLGFLKTVNRALRLHGDRDCVLLNADTCVGPGWLERLRRAAYQAPDIATVTPLSNNGELMSFPRIAEVNPMPNPAETARIDALAAEVNAGRIVDVPVGVGFCLFVRRVCLDAIGLLDEENYDRGYGEESDLCLRAVAAGWRNVCAPDIFVAHVGTVSFGEEKRGLVLNNLDILRAKYPDYVRSGERFLRQDPLLAHRRRLGRALLPSEGDALLMVADAREGASPAPGERTAGRVLWLRPEIGKQGLRYRLEGDAAAGPASLYYRLPEDFDDLLYDLGQAGVRRIEFHDTGSHDPAILKLPRLLKVPYAVIPHDYALICVCRTLIGAGAGPCRCAVTGNGPGPAATQVELRDFLTHADERQLATHSAARIFAEHYPEAPFTVRPAAVFHSGSGPAAPPGSSRGRVTIAVVDAEDVPGGFLTLLAMAREAAASDLPLDFVVFGATMSDLALIRTGRVAVIGTTPFDSLCDAARVHGCHLAVTLAGWLEVDASGIDRAAATRLPVAGLGIGATAERLGMLPSALMLDPSAGAAATNRSLLAFAGHSGKGAV